MPNEIQLYLPSEIQTHLGYKCDNLFIIHKRFDELLRFWNFIYIRELFKWVSYIKHGRCKCCVTFVTAQLFTIFEISLKFGNNCFIEVCGGVLKMRRLLISYSIFSFKKAEIYQCGEVLKLHFS